MLLLHKLLPLIVSPLGFVIGLLSLSMLLQRRWIGCMGILVLVVCSLPVINNTVWASLESSYPPQTVQFVSATDAIVVLSGMLGGVDADEQILTQYHDSIDRLFVGVELYHANKAPLLIFTGGQMPWSELPPEGEILSSKAVLMGVPRDNILLTHVASNTADEARVIRALMDQKSLESIILVTSSFHMPRALKIFEHAGIKAVPYATDFRSRSQTIWLDWIPSAEAFGNTSRGFREYLGRLYYLLKHRI